MHLFALLNDDDDQAGDQGGIIQSAPFKRSERH
jgi:hypothetical protein